MLLPLIIFANKHFCTCFPFMRIKRLVYTVQFHCSTRFLFIQIDYLIEFNFHLRISTRWMTQFNNCQAKTSIKGDRISTFDVGRDDGGKKLISILSHQQHDVSMAFSSYLNSTWWINSIEFLLFIFQFSLNLIPSIFWSNEIKPCKFAFR